MFLDARPVAMADIAWSLFSGIVLWEASKSIINGNEKYLRKTLGLGFRIFANGIRKG
jgi:hypothetical protein